ncbi:TadE/TadG family type IV pilus assembly protein [Oryzibacter oryziterrae]|uniref:TadE/TadG family type IV pilus assembly protein n=1 Tax=Oryzibacter oryziterrae TaxID=2766474 RepID=UPI001F351326|nr:TadE/TadG family type IV pilus assembly protein [Oryzibacter oryziterrae]
MTARAKRRLCDWKRFWRGTDGSVAVEFAFISIPLFGLVFGIIELSLMYFSGTLLDHAADTLAREIRTGHAHVSNVSKADAKTLICDGVLDLFNCRNQLQIFITSSSDITSITPVNPIVNGDINKANIYDIGRAKYFVILQVYLPWSSFFNIFTSTSITLKDGRYLLGSTLFFRNEPYDEN